MGYSILLFFLVLNLTALGGDRYCQTMVSVSEETKEETRTTYSTFTLRNLNQPAPAEEDVLVGGYWVTNLKYWVRSEDCRWIVWETGYNQESFFEILDVTQKSIRVRFKSSLLLWISSDSKWVFGYDVLKDAYFAYHLTEKRRIELGQHHPELYFPGSQTTLGVSNGNEDHCLTKSDLTQGKTSSLVCEPEWIQEIVLSPDQGTVVYSSHSSSPEGKAVLKSVDLKTEAVTLHAQHEGDGNIEGLIEFGYQVGQFSPDSKSVTFLDNSKGRVGILNLETGIAASFGSRADVCFGFLGPKNVYWLERLEPVGDFRKALHVADLSGKNEVNLGTISVKDSLFIGNALKDCTHVATTKDRILYQSEGQLRSAKFDGSNAIPLFPIEGEGNVVSPGMPASYFLQNDIVWGPSLRLNDYEIIAVKADGTQKRRILTLFGGKIPQGLQLDATGKHLYFSYVDGQNGLDLTHIFTDHHLETGDNYYPFGMSGGSAYQKRYVNSKAEYRLVK